MNMYMYEYFSARYSGLLNIAHRTRAMYVPFKHFFKSNCMLKVCSEVQNHIIILNGMVFESYFKFDFHFICMNVMVIYTVVCLFVLHYLVKTLF